MAGRAVVGFTAAIVLMAACCALPLPSEDEGGQAAFPLPVATERVSEGVILSDATVTLAVRRVHHCGDPGIFT